MAGYQFIEKSPLWLDIKPIMESGSKPIKFEYRGMLHTEKEDFNILKIISIDVVRDYMNNIGDYVHIEFNIPLGDYLTKLYPYRTNLELTLKKIQLEELSTNHQTESDILIEKFKAIFMPNDNPVFTGSQLEMYDSSSLNTANIVSVKLQLINRALEPLRIKTVSGVYRNVTQQQLLQNLLSAESNKILIDGKPSIDGVDVIQPDNKKMLQHVVIKDGLHLTELPTFLHEKMGGVYNSGIGNYLQQYKNKKIWFVYPLCNINRFDTNTERVIFYSIPEERFQGLDRTYRQDGSLIEILANGKKQYQDSADTELMNKGSGFKMSNASSFMKKPIDINEEGLQAKTTNLNYEVIHEERSDGLNYAPVSNNAISSNPFTEYSKIIMRSMARIDITWENANPDLLYPGMPCQYTYLDKDQIIKLKGIIVFVHAYSSLQGSGITSTTYRTVCQITILAEKAYIKSTETLQQSPGVF